jgi:hypothetical protein
MASILKVDQLQSDSGTVNLASNLAFTGAATFVGNIANPTITGTLNLTGGGIKFPATQISSADGNTLDDYEEGTWTPTFAGSTTNPSVTQSTQSYGSYTKIGRIVYATFHIHVTAVSSQGSGNLRIAGFPYSQIDDASVENGAVFYQGSAFGFTGLGVLTARGISSTQILISSIDSNGSVGTRNTGSLTTGYVSGSYTYLTN